MSKLYNMSYKNVLSEFEGYGEYYKGIDEIEEKNERDKKFWKECCEEDSISQYNDYIRLYPDGLYVYEAKKEIEEIKEIKKEKIFKKFNNVILYDRYSKKELIELKNNLEEIDKLLTIFLEHPQYHIEYKKEYTKEIYEKDLNSSYIDIEKTKKEVKNKNSLHIRNFNGEIYTYEELVEFLTIDKYDEKEFKVYGKEYYNFSKLSDDLLYYEFCEDIVDKISNFMPNLKFLKDVKSNIRIYKNRIVFSSRLGLGYVTSELYFKNSVSKNKIMKFPSKCNREAILRILRDKLKIEIKD